MANIFKTTLKKDVIADIVNNNTREIRFPITKFWATRLTDEYNLDEKSFVFRSYDSLELSSPSNKGTDNVLYIFDFVRTFVDDNEFVVEFKTIEDKVDTCSVEEQSDEDEIAETTSDDLEELTEMPDDTIEATEVKDVEEPNTEIVEDEDLQTNDDVCEYETPYVSNVDTYDLLKDWFDDNNVLDNLYEDENVFATNARQVIILPKGKVLGSKKTFPVNNDVEVRVEFDMSDKIYFDATHDLDVFVEEVYRTLGVIRKNNFVFVWKRYTGIFMDECGRIYFGIKYSTRKSIGFNRKYNVQ
jgi:hypothetical protein